MKFDIEYCPSGKWMIAMPEIEKAPIESILESVIYPGIYIVDLSYLFFPEEYTNAFGAESNILFFAVNIGF